MTRNQGLEYIDFHDADVSVFRLEKDTLHITVGCCNDPKRVYEPVELVFYGMRDLRIDDIDASIFEAVYDDGEILRFDILDDTAKQYGMTSRTNSDA